MKERWGAGIFLGKLWSSDECILFAEDEKLVKTRSVKRMLEEESRLPDELGKVNMPRSKAQIVSTSTSLEEKIDEGGDEPTARQ